MLLVVVEVFLKTLLAVAKGGARSVRGKVEAKGNLEVLSLSTIRSELDRAESKLNAASETE